MTDLNALADRLCPVCGVTQNFNHDHRPDNTGLDDGPELRPTRKKSAPKSHEKIRDIRNRAWISRRLKYGERGHR